MKVHTFRVIIEPDENNTFHGFVPSLPGCHTWGGTIEETQANLKDAIKVCMANLKTLNEPLPKEVGFEFFQTVSEDELTAVTL